MSVLGVECDRDLFDAVEPLLDQLLDGLELSVVVCENSYPSIKRATESVCVVVDHESLGAGVDAFVLLCRDGRALRAHDLERAGKKPVIEIGSSIVFAMERTRDAGLPLGDSATKIRGFASARRVAEAVADLVA